MLLCVTKHMKTTTNTFRFLFASLVGLSAVAVEAADKAAPPAGKSDQVTRIDVQFLESDRFTDIGDSATPSPAARQADLTDLRAHLVTRAAHYVPAGQKLEITFLDIDRAGGFEPWRTPSLSDVRIVKTIYPPSMKFSYRLTDVNGAVIKQGERTLRDLNFTVKIYGADRSDPLYYEKGMLDDWLNDEFHAPKA